MLKTIFPTKKPFIDKKGNLNFPTDMRWGGVTGLTIRETLYLLAYEATNGDIKHEVFKLWMSNMGKPMSRTTEWRTKKSLERKGYL